MQQSHAFGLIVYDIANLFFAEVIVAICIRHTQKQCHPVGKSMGEADETGRGCAAKEVNFTMFGGGLEGL